MHTQNTPTSNCALAWRWKAIFILQGNACYYMYTVTQRMCSAHEFASAVATWCFKRANELSFAELDCNIKRISLGNTKFIARLWIRVWLHPGIWKKVNGMHFARCVIIDDEIFWSLMAAVLNARHEVTTTHCQHYWNHGTLWPQNKAQRHHLEKKKVE